MPNCHSRYFVLISKFNLYEYVNEEAVVPRSSRQPRKKFLGDTLFQKADDLDRMVIATSGYGDAGGIGCSSSLTRAL